jgi:hypothetical protein
MSIEFQWFLLKKAEKNIVSMFYVFIAPRVT